MSQKRKTTIKNNTNESDEAKPTKPESAFFFFKGTIIKDLIKQYPDAN